MRTYIHTFITILFICCSCNQGPATLPVYGPKKVHTTTYNGKERIETENHTIGEFSFLNQFNDTVDNNTLKNKVFIVSCFHSTFQTKADTLVKMTLDSIYNILGELPDFYILYQTVDPVYDTPEILRQYCELHQITGKNRYFLTGQQPDSLYKFLRYKYLIVAERDTANMATGGFLHSNQIILVDRQQRIRGFYDGTQTVHIGKLVTDIKTLLYTDTL